jgi:hypothetical protein
MVLLDLIVTLLVVGVREMDRKDFLLVMVSKAEYKPLTPVQLQKSLFLISKNLTGMPDPFYSFEAYHYGPFDIEIYTDADSLEEEGLLISRQSNTGRWKETAITPNGLKNAKALESELPEPAAKYVREIVQWVQLLSFSDLVKAIYNLYPEYRENSVFQG